MMKQETKTFLFGSANGKAQIIARIAILMAATVVIQYLTGLIGGGIQLLTGSFVNLFLLLSALLCGFVGGVAIGLVTPFIALAVGLNPNIVLVPFIAFSNALLVTAFTLVCFLLKLRDCKKVWEQIAVLVSGFLLGALLKFLFMYFICVQLIFLLFVQADILKAPALTNLAAAWGIMQFATACIGGAVATSLYFPLKKVKLITYGEIAEETSFQIPANLKVQESQVEENPITENSTADAQTENAVEKNPTDGKGEKVEKDVDKKKDSDKK